MTKEINILGLGTAAIGRPQYINIKKSDADIFSLDQFRKKGKGILEEAYQKGIRYFDTAPGYGLAEELLIDWVNEKKDPTIEVASKWGYTYIADFNPKAKQHEVKEHSLKKLNEQWEQTRLLNPTLSTYQIHSATLTTGVLENVEIHKRLAELKSKFNLKMGITTTGENQVEVIKTALKVVVDGNPLFDAFQVTYNIFDQSLAVLSDTLESLNKRVIIKEAMANGRIFPNQKYSHYKHAYNILQSLAKKYRVGIDAIALRFCVESIKSYKVLSGASQLQHLWDNLKVNDFALDKDDLELLEQLAVSPETYWKERSQLNWN
jgi:aryl-alcohol dehydrogenase-like predicted oxidoreductase